MTKTLPRSDAAVHKKIQQAALELFSEDPDWATFFREVLGLNGIVRRRFPSPEGLAEFERSETYATIQQMLTRLRERPLPSPPRKNSDENEESSETDEKQENAEAEETEDQEPTKVITVRLPKSMHEALRVEAYEHHTSMNKLCISKLLQFIDGEYVPEVGKS